MTLPYLVRFEFTPTKQFVLSLSFAKTAAKAADDVSEYCRTNGPFAASLSPFPALRSDPWVSLDLRESLFAMMIGKNSSYRGADTPTGDHCRIAVMSPDSKFFWVGFVMAGLHKPNALINSIDNLLDDATEKKFVAQPGPADLLRLGAWAISQPRWRAKALVDLRLVFADPDNPMAAEFHQFLQALPKRVEERKLLSSLRRDKNHRKAKPSSRV